MAIPADTILEVRTTGSDSTCSGGFSTTNKGATGVDYSQQDSAQYTYTSDLTCVGSTTIISAGSHFTTDILGNLLFVQSAYFCVVGFTDSAHITVDRAAGTFTTVTGYVGGSLASPGQAALVLALAGAGAYIKSGTYSIANGTANTSGQKINTGATAFWQGYGSSRGDYGAKPVFQSTGNSMTIFTLATFGAVMENIEFQSGSATGVQPLIVTGQHNLVRLVKANGFGSSNGGICVSGSINTIFQCESTGGTGSAPGFLFSSSTGSKCIMCTSHSNADAGFSDTNGYTFYDRCIAWSNSARGFYISTPDAFLDHCIAYNNTGIGFACGSGSDNVVFMGCIAEANTTYGFDCSVTNSSIDGSLMMDCATYNNTTAAINHNPRLNINQQALSGSAFNSAPSDFGINNTALAGALCRSVATSWPGLASTTGYPDIGAIQHTAVAGYPTRARVFTGM